MPLSEQNLDPAQHGPWDFASTHWSVVLLAGQTHSPQSAAALEQLCRTYWYPLYAYVRRQGHSAEAAADLTQEFFSRLLANNGLAAVDPNKGKYRTFLLASMKHLLANEWHRAQTQKRGGGCAHFSLDATVAEDRYRLDPVDELSPEKIYERRWAETLIDSVTRQLQEEYAANNLAARFDALKVFLLGDNDSPSYAEAARQLGLTEGAVRTAIYRMRQRYGELFRAEIAQTVSGQKEMEEEIRHFFSALGHE